MSQRTLLWSGRLIRCGATALVALLVVAGIGCTRRFYRNQADRDVAGVIAGKDVFPDWKIENYNGAYPDARARFSDPTNPDRPPMPPDDPAAKMLGPNPQKPRHAGIGSFEGTGYLDLLASWDALNRDPARPAQDNGPIQQAAFRQPAAHDGQQVDQLPPPRLVEENRPFLITLEQAVELGLINSREFQTKREDLYLAALPVTQERFAFAFQFFALEEAIREYTGINTPNGKGDHWALGTGTGFTKLFSTGALMLLSFANRTIIDLSGRKDLASISTVNFDLVQPFLRGGGQAVTLEPLTGVERNLLYEIRNYARFRKEYFLYIASGVDLVDFKGTASAFGRAFAPGTVVLNSGDLARPGLLPSGAGRVNLTVSGAAAPSAGFLPTLLSKGFVRIDRDNIKRLEYIVRLFKAYEEGGDVSSLQTGLAQLQLYDGQTALLADEKVYRDSLDNFKLQLGVPPPLPIELAEDRQIGSLFKQFADYEAILTQFEQAVKQLEEYDDIKEALQARRRLLELFTKSTLAAATEQFKSRIGPRWDRWTEKEGKLDDKGLLSALEVLYGQRRWLLKLRTDRDQPEKALPLLGTTLSGLMGSSGQGAFSAATFLGSLSPDEERQLALLEGRISLGEMEMALRNYEREPWKKEAKAKKILDSHKEYWVKLHNAVVSVLGEASNERFKLLIPAWPALPPAELAGEDLVGGDLEKAYELGTRTALDNRLDLMNARAQLVDAWRQVAVYANSLLGVFNIGYHMDSSTPPGEAKPFAFQPANARHQLFLNAELPLVRLAERNNYRAALIAYQQARRALMAAEDNVAVQVRADLRQVQVLAQNYKIQRDSVELAFQQVESALETFRAPQPPASQGGGSTAGSVAALTQQLLGAYGKLPSVQRLLLTTWIQYQIARQQLYLDLELMPLDSRGVWIDEFANRPLPAPRRDAVLAIP